MATTSPCHREGVLEWATAIAPMPGETACGDAAFTRAWDDHALAAVIDGLGHGEEAADASRIIAARLAEGTPAPLDPLFRRCHEAARRTRGAAMTAAYFEAATHSLEWMGVGNVSALLLRPHASPMVAARAMCGAGIVGYRLPRTLVSARVPLTIGDIVVMMTDGVNDDLAALLPADVRSAGVDELASHVLTRGARGTDDALVWAGRYLGRPAPFAGGGP